MQEKQRKGDGRGVKKKKRNWRSRTRGVPALE